MHGVDGVFDDGEAKTGAAVCAPAAGAVDGVEAFEYAFLVFGGDAHAGISDFEDEDRVLRAED